jgi:hypothetical protein
VGDKRDSASVFPFNGTVSETSRQQPNLTNSSLYHRQSVSPSATLHSSQIDILPILTPAPQVVGASPSSPSSSSATVQSLSRQVVQVAVTQAMRNVLGGGPSVSFKSPLQSENSALGGGPSVSFNKSPLQSENSALGGGPSLSFKSPLQSENSALGGDPSVSFKSPLQSENSALGGGPSVSFKSPLQSEYSALSGGPSVSFKSPLQSENSAMGGGPSVSFKSPLQSEISSLGGGPSVSFKSPLQSENSALGGGPSVSFKSPLQSENSAMVYPSPPIAPHPPRPNLSPNSSHALRTASPYPNYHAFMSKLLDHRNYLRGGDLDFFDEQWKVQGGNRTIFCPPVVQDTDSGTDSAVRVKVRVDRAVRDTKRDADLTLSSLRVVSTDNATMSKEMTANLTSVLESIFFLDRLGLFIYL